MRPGNVSVECLFFLFLLPRVCYFVFSHQIILISETYTVTVTEPLNVMETFLIPSPKQD